MRCPLPTSHGQQAVEPLHILDAIVTEDDSVGVYLRKNWE